jgi:hypothetical protein
VVIDDEGHRGGRATHAALVQATDMFAAQSRLGGEHRLPQAPL